MDLHKDSVYSDIVLLICDEADPFRSVQFQIDTHRLILYACSTYFARCFTFGQKTCNTTTSTLVSSMCLALNFVDGLTEEMVRLFFRLFYVRRFDSKHLGDEDGDLVSQIESNIFFLYQLALRFHFDPLVEYCESLLFESWGIEYFAHLSRFCLIKNSVSGRYAIIDERLKLYARFLQWYQCCVDHIPYSPLLAEDDTAKSNSRRYFSCQKEEILREHYENVDNITACHIPTKSHLNVSHDVMRLEYYRKICASCLFNHKTKHSYEGFYLINFGALKKYYLNGHEQYFFRLKRRLKPTTTQLGENVLELSLLRTYYKEEEILDEDDDAGEDNTSRKHSNRRHSASRIKLLIQQDDSSDENYCESISVEGEEKEEEEGAAMEEDIVDKNRARLEQMPLVATSKYRCKTLVTLLSKKVETDTMEREYTSRDFSLPTEINNFEMHQEKWCYAGQCDTCHNIKPIYIIQMDIHLERGEPPFLNVQ
jgi:hypothetical protein